MQKKIVIEASNNEEALKKAQEAFHVAENRIFVNEIGENQYEALLDVNLALEGKNYVIGILDAIGVDYNIEVRKLNDETELHFIVDSNENPLLIGNKGKTLEALQTLIKNLISVYTKERMIITLDIGSYKANRKQQLEILATKIGKEVAKTKNPVKLRPMSAFDRRIIHEKLADWKDVFTESEGEGEDRAIVIKPRTK
jgi:spoIIIJ-associated protein